MGVIKFHMIRTIRFIIIGFFQVTILSSIFGEELRVATYNLKNYLIMDRMVGGNWRPAYPKPESEKTIIRQAIIATSPDILVLQEIGSCGMLEELRDDLALEGVDYSYMKFMRGADLERAMGVLSKHYPKNVTMHNDLTFKYFNEQELVKRGMLEMSFCLGDDQVFQLFGVHLKSRYTDNKNDSGSKIRRELEARACRNRLIERTLDQGSKNYLVTGDFNENPIGAPMRRFYKKGDIIIGSLVPATDSRGEYWTYFFSKESSYETIDGFIASPAMLERIQPGSGHILDLPEGLNGSDHRLVYIDIGKGVSFGQN